MKIKPVRTKTDLRNALKRIDALIDAEPGSADYDELEILSVLVEAYEDKHVGILPPDPVEAIRFRMEQMGLRQVDVAKHFGGTNRASEVLSRRRPLSLRMIRNLHRNLNIPTESLIA